MQAPPTSGVLLIFHMPPCCASHPHSYKQSAHVLTGRNIYTSTYYKSHSYFPPGAQGWLSPKQDTLHVPFSLNTLRLPFLPKGSYLKGGLKYKVSWLVRGLAAWKNRVSWRGAVPGSTEDCGQGETWVRRWPSAARNNIYSGICFLFN